MKKFLIGMGVFILAAAAVLMWKGEPLALGFAASQIEARPLAERKALLEPFIQVRLPETGAAPYPAVIQFHGCGGMRQAFHDQWAEVALAAGYAAIIVDSNRPRGVTRENAYTSICAGKRLLGQERAGDVLAAIDLAARRDDIDETSFILAAWSHGAWSVMDYLSMDLEQKAPAGIEPADFALPAIDGAILFYPYCGRGSWTRINGWTQAPDTLALIAGADSIVEPSECIKEFGKLREGGVDVAMHIYPDAEHAFDDPFMEAPYDKWHHPENTEDAKDRYRAFLGAH